MPGGCLAVVAEIGQIYTEITWKTHGHPRLILAESASQVIWTVGLCRRQLHAPES